MLGQATLLAASNSADAAAAWTPAQIPTALWLNAADSATITTVDGAVSQWNDKSGNARHATQGTAGNRPVVSTWSNGGITSNALSFTNTQFLSGSVALTQFSIFAVCNRFTASDAVEWILKINNSSGINMVFIGNLATGSYATGYSPGNNNWEPLTTDSPSRSFRGSFLCGANKSASQLLPHFNGEYLTAKASPNINTTSAYLLPQNLGCQLSELIILPYLASTDTFDRVNSYLAWNWGLQGSLSAGNAYKNAPP